MPCLRARILTLAASLVLGIALLGGCATPTDQPGTVEGTGTMAELDFAATTLEGEQFDGTALEGTPTVLWFWAPWCPTCRGQIPNVTALAEEYDGQVEVIGVGGLDSAAAIRELATDQIPHLTHLVDDEGTVWKHFGVTAQSTYEVIDADGEIVSSGYLDDTQLNDLVAQLVE